MFGTRCTINSKAGGKSVYSPVFLCSNSKGIKTEAGMPEHVKLSLLEIKKFIELDRQITEKRFPHLDSSFGRPLDLPTAEFR